MRRLNTRPLEPEDRVWASKAREEEAAALSNLRGTAEKWALWGSKRPATVRSSAVVRNSQSSRRNQW